VRRMRRGRANGRRDDQPHRGRDGDAGPDSRQSRSRTACATWICSGPPPTTQRGFPPARGRIACESADRWLFFFFLGVPPTPPLTYFSQSPRPVFSREAGPPALSPCLPYTPPPRATYRRLGSPLHETRARDARTQAGPWLAARSCTQGPDRLSRRSRPISRGPRTPCCSASGVSAARDVRAGTTTEDHIPTSRWQVAPGAGAGCRRGLTFITCRPQGTDSTEGASARMWEAGSRARPRMHCSSSRCARGMFRGPGADTADATHQGEDPAVQRGVWLALWPAVPVPVSSAR